MRRRMRVVECVAAGLLSVAVVGAVASASPIGEGGGASVVDSSQSSPSQGQGLSEGQGGSKGGSGSSAASQGEDARDAKGSAGSGGSTDAKGSAGSAGSTESTDSKKDADSSAASPGKDASDAKGSTGSVATGSTGSTDLGSTLGNSTGSGSASVGSTGSAGKPESEQGVQSTCAAYTPQEHIVNGSFEYPQFNFDPIALWFGIDPVHGYRTPVNRDGPLKFPIDGFCRSDFGWSSTESGWYDPAVANWTDGMDIELQKWNPGGNQQAEIVATKQGQAIYQDVKTAPGAVYKWRLKHASRYDYRVDTMKVMIGPSGGALSAQQATRMTSNGAGDQVGEVGHNGDSTLIATKNPDGVPGSEGDIYGDNPVAPAAPRVDYTKAYETYEGSYTVPAGQELTRFSFQSVDGAHDATGNLVDDISFSVAYRVSYDLNGGAGTAPDAVSPGGAGTGACATHQTAGEGFMLPTAGRDSDCWDDSMVSHTDAGGHMDARFVGWSTERHGPYDGVAAAQAATIQTPKYQMPASALTLYAVWVRAGQVSYMPNADDATGSTASSGLWPVDVPYVVAANGFSRPDARFTGWNTSGDGSGTVYAPGDALIVTAGMDLVLYARWQDTGFVRYDGNGPTGVSVTGSMQDSAVVDVGSPSPALASSGFSREGFLFREWNTRADGTGVSYMPSQKVKIERSGATVLYAVWVRRAAALPLTGVPWWLVVARAGGCVLLVVMLLLGCRVLERRYQQTE